MKQNKQKRLYASPETVWCNLQEDDILCQSSSLPSLDEGQHDFNWTY